MYVYVRINGIDLLNRVVLLPVAPPFQKWCCHETPLPLSSFRATLAQARPTDRSREGDAAKHEGEFPRPRLDDDLARRERFHLLRVLGTVLAVKPALAVALRVVAYAVAAA